MIYVFDVPMKKIAELLSIAENEKKALNKQLAGNIKKEIDLEKYTYLLEDFLLHKLSRSGPLNQELNKLNIIQPNPLPIKLRELWVNYQKKHEFNPVHNHSGIISFIIFAKVPYWMADEHRASPGVDAIRNLSGVLQFIKPPYPGYNNHIELVDFNIDAGWVGKGMMFFSNLNHCVYPFYSSDDYRITFAGNFYLSNDTSA